MKDELDLNYILNRLIDNLLKQFRTDSYNSIDVAKAKAAIQSIIDTRVREGRIELLKNLPEKRNENNFTQKDSKYSEEYGEIGAWNDCLDAVRSLLTIEGEQNDL